MYRISCDILLLGKKEKGEVQLPAAIKSQIHEADTGDRVKRFYSGTS